MIKVKLYDTMFKNDLCYHTPFGYGFFNENIIGAIVPREVDASDKIVGADKLYHVYIGERRFTTDASILDVVNKRGIVAEDKDA